MSDQSSQSEMKQNDHPHLITEATAENDINPVLITLHLKPSINHSTGGTAMLPDLRQPAIVWAKQQQSPLSASAKKQQSQNVSFEIAVDYPGHDTIDLTPSHQIAPESTQDSESQEVQTSTSASDSHLHHQDSKGSGTASSTDPRVKIEFGPGDMERQFDSKSKKEEESETVHEKWQPNEWDANRFESDNKNMSLAVVMDLANQLSLLRSHLEMYRQFNIRLGGESNPRCTHIHIHTYTLEHISLR